MSADSHRARAAFAEDLELTEEEAAGVRGGMYPVEPGEDMSTRLPRVIIKRCKCRRPRRHYPPPGGHPV